MSKPDRTDLKACYHRITLSARASTFGGMVRSICLAALRLMINPNLVGCTNGKIGRLCAFYNFIHICSGAPIKLGNVRTIGDERTTSDNSTPFPWTVYGSLWLALQLLAHKRLLTD